MPTKPTIIELDMNKLDDILRRVEAKELRAEDYETIRTVIESYVGLYFAVGDKNTTIRRLRQMLFGVKTEKTAAVVGERKELQLPPTEDANASTAMTAEGKGETASTQTTDGGEAAETPRKGHGRNGADAYVGAEKIEVRRESLQPGDPCPQCEDGTVYETNRPGVLVRLIGQAPVGAKVYYLQKLRCNVCGVVCRHVLESLSAIYHNDAMAHEQKLSPEGRLCFHQAESSPVMEELHVWLVRQFDDRLVEPNSALGGAISYLLRHWEKLTLFLRVPGAPLDNNICEQALKKVIRHRRNPLFYKTQHGAHVGDVFISLIHTCELCGANPFDYLTELERHTTKVISCPQDWMPWNYRQALIGSTSPSAVTS